MPDTPAPSAITDASRWLRKMVELAQEQPETPVVTVDAPLVETPILMSTLGAVVTVLDWRPTALLSTDRSKHLMLNVTLPFEPIAVDSAQGGPLTWYPHLGSDLGARVGSSVSGKWHTGTVILNTPMHGADYVSFYHKPTQI